MRRCVAGAMFLLLGGSACATAPTGSDPRSAASAATEGPWVGRVPAALEERIRRLTAALQPAGWRPGEIWGHGFLTSGGETTETLTLPAEACVTLVAVASGGVRDLDVAVFEPSGGLIAEDVQPDPHPTVQLCTGEHPRRLYYHLRAYDGTGAFAYVAFVGDSSRFDDAALTLGGQPGLASMGGDEPVRDQRIEALVAGAARRGFRRVADPIDIRVARSQRVRVPLRAQAAHCYTVAAFPTDGLEDVDLRVLDRLDRVLARDVSASADPAVQLCADQTAPLVVELSGRQGEGVARLVVLQADAAELGGETGLWYGERPPFRTASNLRWDPPGHRGASLAARGVLGAGEARRVSLPPASTGCERIEIIGGRGVAQFRYRLDRLWPLTSSGSSGFVHRCGDSRASTLDIAMHEGFGEYAVTLAPVVMPRGFDRIPHELRSRALDVAAEGKFLGLETGPVALVTESGWSLDGDNCFEAVAIGRADASDHIPIDLVFHPAGTDEGVEMGRDAVTGCAPGILRNAPAGGDPRASEELGVWVMLRGVPALGQR